MVNRVVLVGRLVKDPELRVASNGMSFLPFTIAVDNKTKETDGTKGEQCSLIAPVFREQGGKHGEIHQKRFVDCLLMAVLTKETMFVRMELKAKTLN